MTDELERAAASLQRELGLGEPFRDPGVAEFGLANVVFAIGDCFLEVVAPTGPGTAAGRQLQRLGGEGGYMVLFDLEDLEGARERARLLRVRTVWQIDLPDISGTHLHPTDVPGAIVSMDRSIPYGTWRWGGPEWTGRVGRGAPGALDAITVAVPDPQGAARRWGEVLGVAVREGEGGPVLCCDGAEVRFRVVADAEAPGIVQIDVRVPAEVRGTRTAVPFGAARIALSDLRASPVPPP